MEENKITETTTENTGRKTLLPRLGALMSVKSLVTLVLTGVFAYLATAGRVSQEFMLIYTTVIAFYFGTQSQKISEAIEKKEEA